LGGKSPPQVVTPSRGGLVTDLRAPLEALLSRLAGRSVTLPPVPPAEPPEAPPEAPRPGSRRRARARDGAPGVDPRLGFPKWVPRIGEPGAPVRNVIRLIRLPEPDALKPPFVLARVHFGLGPEGRAWLLCRAPLGEPCPTCAWRTGMAEAARAVRGAAAEARRVLVERTAPQPRGLVNLVDLGRPEAGVLVFSCGLDLVRELRAAFGTGPSFRDLTHPETGHDVFLLAERHPSKGYPTYQVRVRETPSRLSNAEWLGQSHDLARPPAPPPAVVAALLRSTGSDSGP
jgi:hypothetical protein